MSQTPTRPTAARKHTRTSDEKRKSELDRGVSMTVDGQVYEVRMGDITPAIARRFRKEAGMSARSLLSEQMSEDPDVDTFAAFVWLSRLLAGETLELDDVPFDYGLLNEDFDVNIIEDAQEDDGSPEA